MFNPFSAPLNIISFGIDVYKQYKQRKKDIKNARTEAELGRILRADIPPKSDSVSKQLHDTKDSNTGQ